MEVRELNLKGVYVFSFDIFKDERGYFNRIFSADIFESHTGKKIDIVQVNHSFTSKKGTFRGFHFQKPPFSEIKIIRCIKGAFQDMFIDLRKDSPSFLRYGSIELSANNSTILYLPEGFAHGFQTLADNTEMIYLHSQFYNTEFESGVNCADPRIRLKLPLVLSNISEKDKNIGFLPDDFSGYEFNP